MTKPRNKPEPRPEQDSKILGQDDEKFTDPLSNNSNKTSSERIDESDQSNASVDAQQGSNYSLFDSDDSRSNYHVPLLTTNSTNSSSEGLTGTSTTSLSDDYYYSTFEVFNNADIQEVEPKSLCSKVFERVNNEYTYYYCFIVITVFVIVSYVAHLENQLKNEHQERSAQL